MAKQHYKSLYFSDYTAETANEQSVILAFNELKMSYFAQIKELSTPELKDLIGYILYDDIAKLAESEERSINQTIKRLIKQNLEKQDKNLYRK